MNDYPYSRRYRRQPKPLAYIIGGALAGAALAALGLMLIPTADANPCGMRCVSYTPQAEREFRQDPEPWRYARMSLVDKEQPILVCAGGAK